MEEPMKVVDIELDDDTMEDILVMDPRRTKSLTNHGLPEHPWCPKLEDDPKEKVNPVKKYFWSKRSAHYLAMKAKAKQERERKRSPREVLSNMAKDIAIREVLQKVGMYDYDCKLNDEIDSENIAEFYLFLLGFFAFTFIMSAIFFFVFDGYQTAMLGILFF